MHTDGAQGLQVGPNTYRLGLVPTGGAQCLQVGLSTYRWGSVPTGGAQCLQVGLSTYRWGSVPTGGAQCLQVGLSAYRWGSVPTGGAQCLQVGLSAYRWGSVPTGGAQCLQLQLPGSLADKTLSEYSCILNIFLAHLGPQLAFSLFYTVSVWSTEQCLDSSRDGPFPFNYPFLYFYVTRYKKTNVNKCLCS